jgi:glycosyltransferase involved in cell wall biosynthesis
VLVTSGQPSANPRLVKEATTLSEAGYAVSVIYAPLSAWADKFDADLFKNTPKIEWIKAGYHPVANSVKYKLARARRKFYETLFRYLPKAFNSPIYALVLFAQELEAKACSIKGDVYIGHNLGALPAVVKAAKKFNAKSGFDAEDYHRGEWAEGTAGHLLTTKVENKYIPSLSYLSTASPLISETYKSIFPGQDVITINNAFSKHLLKPVSTSEQKRLSIFWFSQTVGRNRGIEDVIEAMNILNSLNIELHLLGHCPESYKEELKKLAKRPAAIHFHLSTTLENIFSVAAQFDVGLAAEVPHCINRELCLTNKLFTYILSSNCILASDTQAQKLFLNTYPGVGLLYEHNKPESLAQQINKLYNDKHLLGELRKNAHELAAERLNWEKESEILLSQVSSIVHLN